MPEGGEVTIIKHKNTQIGSEMYIIFTVRQPLKWGKDKTLVIYDITISGEIYSYVTMMINIVIYCPPPV